VPKCGVYLSTVIYFQFQVASSFVFPNANTNRIKSVEYMLIFKFKTAQNNKNLRLNGYTSFEFQIRN